MSKNINITLRIDQDLKNQAELLFDDLGLSLSTAFNMFIKQSLREGALPFKPKTDKHSKRTLRAMREALEVEKDPNAKEYHDVDELFKDLLK